MLFFTKKTDREKERMSEMFVMKKVGRRISELRKQKNMTQLELADKMGVSFQAVSNWERGNSMPDISKLPELAEIFGTTIDDILGAKSALIENAAEGNLEEYVENNPISLEEIKEAAPILKPSQMVVIADKNVEVIAKGASGLLTINGKTYDLSKSGSFVISDDAEINGSAEQEIAQEETPSMPPVAESITEVQPTEDDETSKAQSESESQDGEAQDNIFGSETDFNDLIELMPYLDDEAAAKLMKKLISGGKDVTELLPYMDEDAIGSAAMELYERRGFDAIEEFFQYMDEDDLGKIALKEAEKYGIGRIADIADYLDEDTIDAIARKAGSVKDIIQIVDYVSEDALGEIAFKDAKANGAAVIIPVLDYLDEDDIGRIAAIEADRNGLSGIIPMLDYMDEDDLGRIVLKHCDKNGIKGIEPFLDHLDEDVVAQIAINTIKKQGLKAAKPLLPYLDEDVISEFIKKML